MSSQLSIQLFARLREVAGQSSVQFLIPDEGCLVADLLQALKADPELGEIVRSMTVLTAVNHSMARAEDRILPGDEVALFPPVTGG